MSLETLRCNEKKQNAFLSECFKFTWLGKYQVDIHFTKNFISVFTFNFAFCFEDDLPYVISNIGLIDSHKFYDVKKALDFFNLVTYTLVSDFSIKSSDDFSEFFDFNRIQGFHEWLPNLHSYLK